MPLTAVVNYFNHQLVDLNPQSRLGHSANYVYHSHLGAVEGYIEPLKLQLHNQAVLDCEKLTLLALESQLCIVNEQSPTIEKSSQLPLQHWLTFKEDALFLQRFIHILHILNHLAYQCLLSNQKPLPLIIDMARQPLMGLNSSHDQLLFGNLLSQLRMESNNVMLKIAQSDFISNLELRRKMFSLTLRGYRIGISSVPLDSNCLRLFKDVGVRWLIVEGEQLIENSRDEQKWKLVEQWAAKAHELDFSLWFTQLDDETINLARELGAHAISGNYLIRTDASSQAVLPTKQLRA